MINIYSISEELLASVPITREAIIHEELMASDYVKLSWRSEANEELPAGAYIEYRDERYTLFAPYRPQPEGEAFYRYEPMFHSRVMLWDKTPACIYKYMEDGVTIKSREFEWDFVGAPNDALFVAAQTIWNETGERWTYELADGLPASITLNASHTTVFGVLNDIANACESEWWVDKVNNVIHLSKCEKYDNQPIEVGVHVGAPTINSNNEDYFTRFYAFGSSRNIVGETYINGSIAQPVNKRLTLNPKKYPRGYKDILGHFEDGVFVSDLKQGEIFSKTLVFEEIFPSSKLKVASARKRLKYRLRENEKIEVGKDAQGNPIYEQYAIWYFKIADFEFTEDLIIEGKTLSVNFKSGKLAGREFELSYHKNQDTSVYSDDVESFVVEAGDYEIIIDESEGMVLPSLEHMIPEAGDEIILFNINMPKEYADSAQYELEEELDKEIAKLLADNNNYELESYPFAFQQNALILELGRRVLFKYGGYEFPTRVLMVETNLDCEYQQKIKLGSQIIKGSRQELKEEVRNVGEEVAAMRKQEKTIISLQRDYAQSLRNTVANYLALKDTVGLLQGAFDGFSEGINPVSVETMLILLGDNSLQYRIVNNIDDLVPLQTPITYNTSSRVLVVVESAIVHYTLGINDIRPSSSRDISQYKRWSMRGFTSGVLNDADIAYYLYAKVSKTKEEGDYVLVANKIELEEVDGYYHLLVGVLNKEYSGTREFVRMYGFTSVGAGQINTDIIKSSDGQTYFDLAAGVIAGDIRFKATEGGEKSVEEQFSAVDKNMQNLQDQIDGVVENHFYEGTPTTSNYPASEWTTDEQKLNHIGDTYTDIEEFVDSQTTPNAGKSWRWCRCDDMTGIADYVEATDKDGVTYRLHWHPIADTDAVKALLRVYELEKRVDDSEYLKETFKKGETNISGGVVMTEMVAVGEGGDNIEAFLNGSDFAESEDSGKLILAGGIPATSKSGSVDLEDRAKEAKIKMYEDGDFVMKGGGISVERGNIGPFYIGGTHTLASNEKSPLQDTKVILDTTSMAVVSEDKEDNSDISISIGSKISSTYGALYDADGNSLFSINHSTIRGVKIEANDDGDDIRGVLEIKRGGSGSKCAIAIDRGYIGGLRPRMRIVKSSGTLSNLDHSIMISNSSSLTINLPSNAEVGQVIEIYLPYPNSTTLKHRILGNGLGIQCPHNDTWNNSYFDILAYGVVKFICIADGNGDLHWWFYRIA